VRVVGLVRPINETLIAWTLALIVTGAVVLAGCGGQRPVAVRAILIATSTASEPPVVNSTLERFPGAISASFAARATAGPQV